MIILYFRTLCIQGILPTAQMVISFVGGPNVALQGTVEAVASLTSQQLSVNFNYVGTIGGIINVEVSGYGSIYGPTTFGPVAVIKGGIYLYRCDIVC